MNKKLLAAAVGGLIVGTSGTAVGALALREPTQAGWMQRACDGTTVITNCFVNDTGNARNAASAQGAYWLRKLPGRDDLLNNSTNDVCYATTDKHHHR
jgi:hypothetical protein